MAPHGQNLFGRYFAPLGTADICLPATCIGTVRHKVGKSLSAGRLQARCFLRFCPHCTLNSFQPKAYTTMRNE